MKRGKSPKCQNKQKCKQPNLKAAETENKPHTTKKRKKSPKGQTEKKPNKNSKKAGTKQPNSSPDELFKQISSVLNHLQTVDTRVKNKDPKTKKKKSPKCQTGKKCKHPNTRLQNKDPKTKKKKSPKCQTEKKSEQPNLKADEPAKKPKKTCKKASKKQPKSSADGPTGPPTPVEGTKMEIKDPKTKKKEKLPKSQTEKKSKPPNLKAADTATKPKKTSKKAGTKQPNSSADQLFKQISKVLKNLKDESKDQPTPALDRKLQNKDPKTKKRVKSPKTEKKGKQANLRAADTVKEPKKTSKEESTKEPSSSADGIFKQIPYVLNETSPNIDDILKKPNIDETMNESRSYVDDTLNESSSYVDDSLNEPSRNIDDTLNEQSSYVDDRVNEQSSYMDDRVNEQSSYVDDRVNEQSSYIDDRVNEQSSYIDDRANEQSPNQSIDDASRHPRTESSERFERSTSERSGRNPEQRGSVMDEMYDDQRSRSDEEDGSYSGSGSEYESENNSWRIEDSLEEETESAVKKYDLPEVKKYKTMDPAMSGMTRDIPKERAERKPLPPISDTSPR